MKSSQEVVKILSKFSRLLLTLKVKVIRFLSLHTAQKVYKTVSCLLLSRSFPAQRCLHNVRQTIVRTFLSRCCGIFERVNDWLVVWCLVSPVIMFWLMLRQYKNLLAQTQHSRVRFVLMLLCCHWACKCLMGCLVSGLTWNCVWVSVFVTALLSASYRLYSRT